MKVLQLYKPFREYVRPHFKDYFLIIFFFLILELTGLIPAFIQKAIIDDAIINKDISLLISLIITSIGVFVFTQLLRQLQNYIETIVTQRIDYSAQMAFMQHMLRLPFSFFSKMPLGEILSRIRDSSVVSGIVRIFLNDLCMNIFKFVVNFAACIFISPILSLILIVSAPINFLFSTYMGRYMQKRNWESWPMGANIDSLRYESISGIKDLKVFVAEEKTLGQLRHLTLKKRKFDFKTDMTISIWQQIKEFFNEIFSRTVFFVGIYLVIKSKLTLGQFFAFQIISSRAVGPLLSLTQIFKYLHGSYNALFRMTEILDQTEELYTINQESQFVVKKGTIEFKKVNFSYEMNTPIIKDFNLKIQPGQKIAIVGPSGVGKSTIANLLLKFLQPDSGEILIDGQSITHANVTDLRSQIGFVLQSSYLFSGTIRTNLSMNKSNISNEDIIEACKIANIYDFIKSLPNGLDTDVQEDGTSLSGGQRQRINIARSILQQPKIIVLDEATSSLDFENEKLIQNALDTIMKNRTSIVIAHRLSTIENADVICVLEDGNLTEKGSHKQLMKKNGYYRKLQDILARI